ncbi:FabD/lysophospholipase-like protein [Cadophora sp. DSE1049]|nr:FabD/lysophospholipase-like protein [Cadophora sp. DSE1049]
MESNRPLRILSLDGGGVKGLATLCMLEAIMVQLQLEMPGAKNKRRIIRPCDYFDLICGTSTGGLIAILLGRLRYTVKEAKDLYLKLAKEIFSKDSDSVDSKFDHTVLEQRIKDIIESAPAPEPGSLEADVLLEDESIGTPQGGTRTFVVATRTRGTGATAVRMRSYEIAKKEMAFEAKIWEAARATSAAPTFFSPIKIRHVTYGDGGTGWNNPTKEALNEIHKIWPSRPIACLVSIGCGIEDPLQLVDGAALPVTGMFDRIMNYSRPRDAFRLAVAKYCANCLTSCQRTHEEISSNIEKDGLRGKYFRLNVPLGVGKIGLEEWKKIGDIISLTDDYMESYEGKFLKNRVAQILASPDRAESRDGKASMEEWDDVLGRSYVKDGLRAEVPSADESYTVEEFEQAESSNNGSRPTQRYIQYPKEQEEEDQGPIAGMQSFPNQSKLLVSVAQRYELTLGTLQNFEQHRLYAPEMHRMIAFLETQYSIFRIQIKRALGFELATPLTFDQPLTSILAPHGKNIDFRRLGGETQDLVQILNQMNDCLTSIESDHSFLDFFTKGNDMRDTKAQERFRTLAAKRNIFGKLGTMRSLNERLRSIGSDAR